MGDIYRNPVYRGYGDAGIAKGFDTLAGMFAPPGPQQALIAAKTASERAKVRGLDDFYNYSQDPNTPPERLDHAGVVAGLYAPTQGFGARNMKDATDRRGQDIHSGDTRRGQDVTASTARRGQDIDSADKRYKVNADGRVAVDNNIRDNKRHVDTTLLAPVAQGSTRFVPPGIAEMYDLPPTQTGVIAAQPGERNVLPDGREINGTPKPKTESEVKGDIIAGLTDAEKRAIGFGSTPVETVVVDGKPKPVTRPQQLDLGTPSVPEKNGQVFNYRGGTARQDPVTGKMLDTQTGVELAPGEPLQAPSGVQSKDPLGATTANQTAANQRAATLDVAAKTLDAYESLLKANPGIIGIPGDVRGAAQNMVSVAQEFAAAFGNMAPEAKITAMQAQALATKIGAGSRDPAIQQARILQGDLAYKIAQMHNTGGEVSRRDFEHALGLVTGGTFANNQSALEAITALRGTVERERAGVETLRNPGRAPAPSAAPTPGGARSFQTPSGTFTVQPVE